MLGYVVLKCCDRLVRDSNLSQQHPTFRNRVAKRAQHVAPNNVAICCDRLSGPLILCGLRPGLRFNLGVVRELGLVGDFSHFVFLHATWQNCK